MQGLSQYTGISGMCPFCRNDRILRNSRLMSENRCLHRWDRFVNRRLVNHRLVNHRPANRRLVNRRPAIRRLVNRYPANRWICKLQNCRCRQNIPKRALSSEQYRKNDGISLLHLCKRMQDCGEKKVFATMKPVSILRRIASVWSRRQ